MGYNINNDCIVNEQDMGRYIVGKNAGLIEKIYANNPLLGNYVFSEKNLEVINKNAKIYVDQFVDDPACFNSTDAIKAEMQVTLAIINYAKNWENGMEDAFWSYIVGQFGYRDSNDVVREVLCRCIRKTMKSQKRLFLSDSNGNQYKATIVIHALATKKTWMYLYDFLFDFYKNNLNWTYVENDPSIEQMVRALVRKLDTKLDEKDEDIFISSNVYRFQTGVKKLVLNRPKYTIKLFNRLLKRLDMIIRQEARPARTYEEILADEWIAMKMQHILETKSKRKTVISSREIAVSYDKIHAVYTIENETNIKVRLPDIRLKEEDVGSVYLKVYWEKSLIDSHSLSFYGNELGRTVQGIELDLKKYQIMCRKGSFDIRIQILCGDNIIYDSKNTLYRNCIVFDKKKEINPTLMEIGNYIIVVAQGKNLDIKNAEVRALFENEICGRYYFVQLKAGFVLVCHNQVLAMDKMSNKHIEIILPNVESDLFYERDGVRYRVTQSCNKVHIIMNEDDTKKKYRIFKNEIPIRFQELGFEKKGTSIIYELPIDLNNTGDITKIQIIDLDKNSPVVNEQFIVSKNITFAFNKAIYYSDSDYEDAVFSCSIGTEETKQLRIFRGEEFVRIPYASGEYIFKIPKLNIYDTSGHSWGNNMYYWYEDIPYNTFLRFDMPDEGAVQVYFGEKNLHREPDGSYGIGNIVHSLSNKREESSIELYLRGSKHEKYSLGKIIYKEMFKISPCFKVENDCLSWDMGYGFIGKNDTDFKLIISTNAGWLREFPLNLQEKIIASDVKLDLGEYNYQIVKKSGNIFIPKDQIITEGKFYVGDRDEIRFLSSKIKINKITFYDQKEDRVVSKDIKTIFIDGIVYQGKENVGEDGDCPIYTGTMYFVNRHGGRREYSDQEITVDGISYMKVNPVRIACLNDTILNLVDSTGESFNEGEGLYCYSFIDKDTREIKYSFTDRNYSAWNEKNYRLVDLCEYRKERVD